MTTKYTRLLAAATASIALAGGLAACGDDDTTAGPNGNRNGNGMIGPTASTTPATAADVDAAFIRQMIPHHESAVEMAASAPQDAEHAEIKTLAAAITSGQQTEITEMREIAKRLGASTTASTSHMADDARTLGLSMNEMGMSMGAHSIDGKEPYDQAFIDAMIPHHEGAIAMAKAQQQTGGDKQLTALTQAIITAQTKEIAQMNAWRKAWFGDAEPADSGPGMGGDMDHSGH